MNIIEVLNNGLKREIKIVIPAKDLEIMFKEHIIKAKNKVRLNGFRPGKVPEAYLCKVYGKSLMADIISSLLNEIPATVLSERKESPAMPPVIKITGYEETGVKVERIFDSKRDLVLLLEYEVLPKIFLKDISSLKVIREIVEVPERQINEQMKRALHSTQTYIEEEEIEAERDDKLTIDYSGKLADGTVFEGGSAVDATFVLGDRKFPTEFEEQLIGSKKGDKRQIILMFPKNYGISHLAGKEVSFEVTVKVVARANHLEMNDDMAKKLGLDSLKQLRKMIREQIKKQYETVTRLKLKRQIFDALDANHQFVIPECLFQKEFDTIWKKISTELKKNKESHVNLEEIEKKKRDEYRKIAERRVRLGLLLSQIGHEAKITVTEEELKQAVYAQANRYHGQEKEIINFLYHTPTALNSVYAPIFEEKIVDYLLGQIKVLDKIISSEELLEYNSDKNLSLLK